MTHLTLQLSDKSVMTLPTQLARQAGLEAGQVQIILGKQRLIVIPLQVTKEAKAPNGSFAPDADTSKTNDWEAYTTALHELVTPYTFPAEDQRDEMNRIGKLLSQCLKKRGMSSVPLEVFLCASIVPHS